MRSKNICHYTQNHSLRVKQGLKKGVEEELTTDKATVLDQPGIAHADLIGPGQWCCPVHRFGTFCDLLLLHATVPPVRDRCSFRHVSTRTEFTSVQVQHSTVQFTTCLTAMASLSLPWVAQPTATRLLPYLLRGGGVRSHVASLE